MNIISIILANGIPISNPYVLLSGACLALILTYFFKRLPKRAYLPFVIILIFAGILLRLGLEQTNIDLTDKMPFMDVVCVIALVIIVLEGSMGLYLDKEKYPMIGRSLLSSLLGLIAITIAISSILYFQLGVSYGISLLFSIPIAVMSSSSVIPSVTRLAGSKREFMIYESSITDIIGIISFYFVITYLETGGMFTTFRFFISLILTILVALVATAILINLFKKLNSQTKLLLLVSNLVLLYSLANLFNLSLLIIVMVFSAVFGLALANQDKFKKLFKRFEIGTKKTESSEKEFHLITLESTYLVKIFFFVVFGMTIDLGNLLNMEVLLISLLITGCIFIIRALILHYFTRPHLIPELYLAPRGLVTILLFLQIPNKYITSDMKPAVLFFVILFTNLIMTFYLSKDRMNRSLPNEDKVRRQKTTGQLA